MSSTAAAPEVAGAIAAHRSAAAASGPTQNEILSRLWAATAYSGALFVESYGTSTRLVGVLHILHDPFGGPTGVSPVTDPSDAIAR